MYTEKQVREEETMRKAFNDVILNIKIRYIFQLSHENKFTSSIRGKKTLHFWGYVPKIKTDSATKKS